MRTEEVDNLRPCPMCGSQAVMRKNASKRFQVKCKKCKCCTAWTSKPQAIILWYNNATLYEQAHASEEE